MSWMGTVYRHIPATSALSVLDFRYAGLSSGNRWNVSGEPTLYLAGDQGVLAVEWARHLPFPWDRNVQAGTIARDVFRIGVRLARVLDLREPGTLAAFGVAPTPGWFIDATIARHVAHLARRQFAAQAILVPTIAFIDDRRRWNLVVFLEQAPPEPTGWVTECERVGQLHWSPSETPDWHPAPSRQGLV